jgi:4-amino-4-deoxy-L-arabinose transferase-like glycosyltransferase
MMYQRYIVRFRLSRCRVVPRTLIALTVLAAGLRLPTLGSQSLWLDETATGQLARGSLGALFHQVAQREATPPLYFVAEWLWTRVAGTSEVALRLPSALCGLALVPVAYGIGQRLAGQRAAVALAALVSVHPLLVYYSQEARGYAAVALACALGFVYFLDVLGDRGGWPGWALASSVALWCHYFAIFPVTIEAAVLLFLRGRRALPGVATVAVVGAGLLPLVIEQIGGDHGGDVTGGVALATRVKGVATSWVVGERGAAIQGLEWIGGLLLVAGAVLLVARGGAPRGEPGAADLRRAAVYPAVVCGGGAASILIAAALGADYLNNRNTIPVFVLSLAIPALGFAIGRLGAALGALACVALGAATIGALVDPAHAREDWRAAARDLGATPAVIVAPPFDATPLRWYAPGLRATPATAVTELAVVVTDPDRDPLPPGALATPPAPGFRLVGTATVNRILIARYRATGPRPVAGADAWARSHLGPTRGGSGAALLGRQ